MSTPWKHINELNHEQESNELGFCGLTNVALAQKIVSAIEPNIKEEEDIDYIIMVVSAALRQHRTY